MADNTTNDDNSEHLARVIAGARPATITFYLKLEEACALKEVLDLSVRGAQMTHRPHQHCPHPTAKQLIFLIALVLLESVIDMAVTWGF